MSFDGIITKAIVTELNQVLIGSKVNKIHQHNKNEISLSLYNNGNNYILNISTSPDFCRINLSKSHKPNPLSALNFCMLLRKYLIGAKITSISNFDLERTIQIKFNCYNELNDLVERKLYIEIMSRQSNIILTNENNIIIDSLKHFDKSLPAHIFEYAPISKKSFIDIKTFEDFLEIVDTSSLEDLAYILSNSFIGFSKQSINAYLAVLNIDPKNYTNDDLKKIFLYLKKLIHNITLGKVCIMRQNSNFLLISNETKDSLIHCDINYEIDTIYSQKEEAFAFKSSKNNLLRLVLATSKKISKKLENINKKLDECKHMETYRLYGELLTSNLYKLNLNSNLESIELENYYDNNQLITIPLDNTISVQKNIQKYFKKYNKSKNTLEIVGNQKKDAIEEINYIESIVFSLENAKNFNDLNDIYTEISQNISTKRSKQLPHSKKASNTPSYETIQFEGYTIYYGKNNIQNSYLTSKIASKNDIWFHVQKIHGSHVILKINHINEDIPESVLFKCAKIAKENSKGSSSLNVPVDYCQVKFVKKMPDGKPGMVNYTNYKTIIIK